MALTADQICFYQDNGYLLLEQAIPSDILTSLRETVDRFIEASVSYTHLTLPTILLV